MRAWYDYCYIAIADVVTVVAVVILLPLLSPLLSSSLSRNRFARA